MKELFKIFYGDWLDWFEIEKVDKKEVGKEKAIELIIHFKEKPEQAPRKNLVQKGFCNPLELIDHPVRGMFIYVKFYRRRWQDPKTGEEIRNNYDLRFPGTKLTKKFADFLKSEDPKQVHELLDGVPYLRDRIKKDLDVVQKSSLGI